jgi:hypothetical protein
MRALLLVATLACTGIYAAPLHAIDGQLARLEHKVKALVTHHNHSTHKAEDEKPDFSLCDCEDIEEDCMCYCAGKGEVEECGDPEDLNKMLDPVKVGPVCIARCDANDACIVDDNCGTKLSCYKPLGDMLDAVVISGFMFLVVYALGPAAAIEALPGEAGAIAPDWGSEISMESIKHFAAEQEPGVWGSLVESESARANLLAGGATAIALVAPMLVSMMNGKCVPTAAIEANSP